MGSDPELMIPPEVIEGTEGFGATLNVAGDELPPPGGGFVTTTLNEPVVIRSDGVSVIFSCVPLMNETECATPLKVTTEEARKPEPLMLNVVPDDPAKRDEGDRLVMAGTGLTKGALTVNTAGVELLPPGAGFVTTMESDPEFARSDAVS